MINISIVIPLFDEQDSIKELFSWIKKVLDTKYRYEVVFIDDGSTDNSWEIIEALAHQNAVIKAIRFTKNFGKTQALNAGFEKCQGKVIVTMDADLQDSPEEIPEMYNLIATQNNDLICGWKKIRHDSYFSKNLPSKLFNAVARKISGLKLHDFNCGLKAFRKEIISEIHLTGDMHRYIPLLVKNAGFKNISEKVVKHQPRKYGKTKFGRERFIKGFLDLLTIWFLSKFAKNPMHFFGFMGLLMFFIGFCLTAYLGIHKVFIDPEGRLITQRPEFYLSLSSMIIGVIFFLGGFIGEIIISEKILQRKYVISKTI